MPAGSAPDQPFAFKVQYNGDKVQFPYAIYSYEVLKDGASVETRTAPVDVAGRNFTVTLKDGESTVINTLPVGSYTITEADYTMQDFAAVEPQTVAITADHTSEAVFHNRYTSYTGDLTVSKTVTKEYHDVPAEHEYHFGLVFTPDAAAMFRERAYTYAVTDSDGTVISEGSGTVAAGADSHTIDFMLEDGQSVTFTDLPVGSYAVTETIVNGSAEDYNVYINDTLSETLIAEGEIAGEQMAVAAFKNEYKRHYGNLQITKHIDSDGNISTIDKVEEFLFYVQLEDTAYDGTVTAKFSGTEDIRPDELITITDGELQVPLADGETVLLEALPAVPVTVTEADYSQQGYEETISYDNETKTIPRDGLLQVECINRYPVKYGTITVTKTVSNLSAVPRGDSQSFIFRISGGNANQKVNMDVVIDLADIRAGGGTASVTIENVPLGTYTITEDTSWSWRYTCTSGATESVMLNADILTGTAAFTNRYDTNTWLTDSDSADNRFIKSTKNS